MGIIGIGVIGIIGIGIGIGIDVIGIGIGVIGMSGFADAGGFLRCAGNCYPVKARRSYQDCFPLGERSFPAAIHWWGGLRY